MKKFKNILLTGIVLILSSCGQEFLDVNTDPNNPAEASYEYALPAAITTTAGTVGGYYAILGGIWSQYYTQNNASNQYKDIEGFYLEPADFQLQWQELYAGALTDYKEVKKQASAKGDWNYYLMATVMEAYTYQVLVDLYDKIPFSEAIKGEEGIIYAKYDEGQAVYDSLIVRIDNALAKDLSAATNTDPGATDLVFGGDMEHWIQFANTLKLKIFLRQSEARPSVAQAGIASLYNSGAQFLNTDAALDVFEDEASKSNPMFEMDQRQLNTPQNLKASRTFFEFLEVNEDPRLDVVYRPQLDGDGNPIAHRAMNQGDFNATSTALPPLTISRARLSATDAVYFISLAESYFLQAEVAQRGWGAGDDKGLYEAGVKTSLGTLVDTLTDQEGEDSVVLASAHLLKPKGKYEYGVFYHSDKLGAIIMQKWAAMSITRQGLEAFFERNRTGYPRETPDNYYGIGWEPGDIVYPKEGVTSLQYGRRLLFPESEVNRNPNTPTQANITDRVWWDK